MIQDQVDETAQLSSMYWLKAINGQKTGRESKQIVIWCQVGISFVFQLPSVDDFGFQKPLLFILNEKRLFHPAKKKRKKSFSILSLKCIPRAFPPNRPFSRTHVIQNLFILTIFFGLISLFSQQQEKITNKKVYLFLLTQESNIYAICLLLLFFASIVFFI